MARLKSLARSHVDELTLDGEFDSLPDGAFTVKGDHMVASIGDDVGALYLKLAANRPGRLTVFADDPGVVARHCAGLALPSEVLGPDGESASITPLPEIVEVIGDHGLADVLVDAGLDVAIEHGRIIGTFRGLAVARFASDGSLEVGIGEVDMAAATMMNGNDATALGRVVAQVRAHRVGGQHHPIGRLSSARWLRCALSEDPSPIGSGVWRDVEPIKASVGVRDETPSCALVDESRLIVCTAGLDRTLIPEVLDQSSRYQVDSVNIVVPITDAPLVARLTDGLFETDSSIVAVAPPWA